MSRIRTIKPEFFTSVDVVGLTPWARLLYIGLWCEADREGRLPWRPEAFKLRYLPTDPCDIATICQELLSRGLIVQYGHGLAHIPTFTKHQHINPRESASVLPVPKLNPSPTRGPRVRTRKRTRQRASVPRQGRDSDAQGGREGREGTTEAVSDDTTSDAGGARAAAPVESSSPLGPQLRMAVLEVVALWNAAMPSVPIDAATVTTAGRRRLAALLQANSLVELQTDFTRISRSSYLSGRDGQNPPLSLWSALDRLDRVRAGDYDDRASKGPLRARNGHPSGTPSSQIVVIDPDYGGQPYRFHCQHSPTCTTWPQCRELLSAAEAS